MPSQISHILHGLEASVALAPGWEALAHSPAFRLGCQGPDIFYHNRRTKPGAFLYGTRLHRRGWGSFLSRFRREALARNWGPDHPGMALLAGMATHGFLDRECHPFIVYFSGWKVPGVPSTDHLRHAHMFLERILDVGLWEQQNRGPLTKCFWQSDLPSPQDFPDDLWTAWAEALHEVFPQLSARAEVELRLHNAVSDTKGFLAFTSPTGEEQGLKAARHGALHYFHPVNLPDWDFLNLSHSPWFDPVTGTERHESYCDLFEAAIPPARQALATLTDPSADWETLLGNGSLNLPGLEGENQAPTHQNPWDFALLFDREAQARLAQARS